MHGMPHQRPFVPEFDELCEVFDNRSLTFEKIALAKFSNEPGSKPLLAFGREPSTRNMSFYSSHFVLQLQGAFIRDCTAIDKDYDPYLTFLHKKN